MSQENVQLVRHFYEDGLIDRDPEWLLELATPTSNTSILPMPSSRAFAMVSPPWRERCERSPRSGRSPGMSYTSFSLWGHRGCLRQLAHSQPGKRERARQ